MRSLACPTPLRVYYPFPAEPYPQHCILPQSRVWLPLPQYPSPWVHPFFAPTGQRNQVPTTSCSPTNELLRPKERPAELKRISAPMEDDKKGAEAEGDEKEMQPQALAKVETEVQTSNKDSNVVVAKSGKTARKSQFTPEEDERLLSLVEQFGSKRWVDIAKQLPGRNRKQVRDHYINILQPQPRKRDFTPEDDARILELISTHGRSWKKIAEACPGRTALALKNHYYFRLQKARASVQSGPPQASVGPESSEKEPGPPVRPTQSQPIEELSSEVKDGCGLLPSSSKDGDSNHSVFPTAGEDFIEILKRQRGELVNALAHVQRLPIT